MSNMTSVTTGEVRLSYVNLFQPRANQPGQDPKYSVTILLPKSDVETKQRIDAAISAAIEKGIAETWNGVRPPQVKLPIHDGDGQRPSGDPFGPECKGHWVFTASTYHRPQIVDINMNDIIDQTKVYSGVYARVYVTFKAYNSNGNRGVRAILGPVQILRDGEPLGGRVTAEQAFGDNPLPQTAPQTQAWQMQAPNGWASTTPSQAYGVSPQAAAFAAQFGAVPQQPAQPQPATTPQPMQIDPITGKPLQGGIMGLG